MADLCDGYAVHAELVLPGHRAGNITANSAAITQFQTNLQNAVTAGFAQQSAKYGGTVPQENPLRYDHTGSAPLPAVPTPDVPAYTPAEQAQFSPVHSAGTAPEAMASSTQDEASIFWNLGIPGFSVGGVQDSNIDENPYPTTTSAAIRSTPVLAYTGSGTAFELAQRRPHGRDDHLWRRRPRWATPTSRSPP